MIALYRERIGADWQEVELLSRYPGGFVVREVGRLWPGVMTADWSQVRTFENKDGRVPCLRVHACATVATSRRASTSGTYSSALTRTTCATATRSGDRRMASATGEPRSPPPRR